MVYDQFHTMGFIVSVDLFIARQIELLKHGRGHKGGGLAAPVIVVEQAVRFQVCADLLCKLQFKIREVIDQSCMASGSSYRLMRVVWISPRW